jgi:hypothetical protein
MKLLSSLLYILVSFVQKVNRLHLVHTFDHLNVCNKFQL